MAAPLIVQVDTTVIELAHVDPEDLFVSKKGAAPRAFKDSVEAESAGSIKVEVYPAGQLGGERELIESTELRTPQFRSGPGSLRETTPGRDGKGSF